MKRLPENGLSLASIIIGFAATLMIFFPALILKIFDTSYTGLQIAFGHTFTDLAGYGGGQIAFSFINVIAYLLPLAGALFLLFTAKGYLISTFLFGFAAILLFLVPKFTVITFTAVGVTGEIHIDWTYGIGLIIAASLSIVGLLIGLFRIYKKI